LICGNSWLPRSRKTCDGNLHSNRVSTAVNKVAQEQLARLGRRPEALQQVADDLTRWTWRSFGQERFAEDDQNGANSQIMRRRVISAQTVVG
jgi:hypothetical protein